MVTEKIKSLLSNYWILLLLVALKLVLQYLLVSNAYELHRDEYLYLDQAFHPAAGYISVPPFTAWMASIVNLMGGGIFWVRLIPALFGAATIVVAWLIVEQAGGKTGAQILTGIFLLFSVLLRLNVLFQPNAFDIFIWTLIFYLLIRYFKSNDSRWLLLLAVATTLGMYNKYTVIFLIAGVVFGIVISPHRKFFANRNVYLAALLSAVLLLPNIIWQIRNGFPVIDHMRALNMSQLVYVDRADFWLDQLRYGLIGIPTLAAFIALLFYKPFRTYRFIGLTFLFVMTLFTISRAKSYYAIGLYPVLFALGSVYIESLLKRWRVAVITLLSVTHVVLFMAVVKFMMPLQSPHEIVANNSGYEKMGLLRWEDGRNHHIPQDFADMTGWREMAGKAKDAFNMIPPEEREESVIICDNYGQAGAVNYYNRGEIPPAYSLTTDYIFWLPRGKTIRNIVVVGDLPDEEILNLFREYRLAGTVEEEFAREKGTSIYLLLGASDEATEMLYQLVETRIKEWHIF